MQEEKPTSAEDPADELLRQVARLIGRLWREPELEARLRATPREVLVEAGLPVPEGVKVEVVLNTESLHHLVLPPPDHPQRQVLELVENDLRASSAVAVVTLEDSKDLIHFVIPAPPSHLDLDLAEEDVVVLAARGALGSAVSIGEELGGQVEK